MQCVTCGLQILRESGVKKAVGFYFYFQALSANEQSPKGRRGKETLYLWNNKWDSNLGLLVHSQIQHLHYRIHISCIWQVCIRWEGLGMRLH